MFNTTRYDTAAAELVAITAQTFRILPTTPAVCPACEAGYHGELAETYHAVFACSCPCRGRQ